MKNIKYEIKNLYLVLTSMILFTLANTLLIWYHKGGTFKFDDILILGLVLFEGIIYYSLLVWGHRGFRKKIKQEGT